MSDQRSSNSEKHEEALHAIAAKLNNISYESDSAYPPGENSGEQSTEDFVDGYQLGLFVAAESGLDVLRDDYELFDNDDLVAMWETDG
jgi:hypothetical protein